MPSLTRTFAAAALAFAALAATSGAQAQMGDYSLYAPGSGYVGLNLGHSDYSLQSGFRGFSFNDDDTDTSVNLYTGSFFNPNFGLEMGYTHFGKINRAGGETQAQGINLSLVGRAPIGPQFNLLGKLGTTYGWTDVSAAPGSGIASGDESGFGVSYGIGAEYVFSPQLSAVLQYDEHRLKFAGTGRDRVGATSVGVRYRF